MNSIGNLSFGIFVAKERASIEQILYETNRSTSLSIVCFCAIIIQEWVVQNESRTNGRGRDYITGNSR